MQHGSIAAQAAAADVVVAGPITDITDLGPADPAGSETHKFRLTVEVEELIKGEERDTVNVQAWGVGDVDRMRRNLSPQDGLWMLVESIGDDLVLVESAGVLFEEDGVLVAPLAESGAKPDARSLDDAKAQAREGAARR